MSRPTVLGALVGLVASGCGGDEQPRLDVSEVQATLGDRIDAEGSVLGISPDGDVLMRVDDTTCAYDLDGDETVCFDVVIGRNESITWSPDGTRAAFGNLESWSRGLDSDVRVVDLETGDVTVMADDGTDDLAGDIDLAPVWASDDELMWLRLPAGRDGDELRMEVVRMAVDGEETDDDATPGTPTEIEALQLGAVGTRTFDDSLVVFRRLDARRHQLLTLDDDGETDRITVTDGTGTIGFGFEGISRDGAAMVVVNSDLRLFEFGPAVFIRADGREQVESGFDVVAAAVDPDGGVVAAVGVDDTSDDRSLTLWDPETDEQVELAPDPDALGVTWVGADRLVLWDFEGWQVVDLDDE